MPTQQMKVVPKYYTNIPLPTAYENRGDHCNLVGLFIIQLNVRGRGGATLTQNRSKETLAIKP